MLLVEGGRRETTKKCEVGEKMKTLGDTTAPNSNDVPSCHAETELATSLHAKIAVHFQNRQNDKKTAVTKLLLRASPCLLTGFILAIICFLNINYGIKSWLQPLLASMSSICICAAFLLFGKFSRAALFSLLNNLHVTCLQHFRLPMKPAVTATLLRSNLRPCQQSYISLQH